MLVRIDPASKRTIFDQLADQLRAAIVTGAVRPGERLPTAADFGSSLGINRNTVLKVYQALRDDGLVELRPGRGAVVARTALAGVPDVVAAAQELVRSAIDAGISQDALCAIIRKEYP